MPTSRLLLPLLMLAAEACGGATEPTPGPQPIANEILVLGWPTNGLWPDWGLYAVQVSGFGSRSVAPSGVHAPAISPDGKAILFAGWLAQEDRGYQIYRMDSEGHNIRRVTGPPILPLAGLDRWPSWAPNGTQIAFIRDHSLMVADPDGKNQRILVDSISLSGRPSWSPDSRMLLYAGEGVSGREDLFRVDVTSGVSTNLTSSSERELYPDWGPANDLIAYVGFDTLTASWQVFRLDLGTGVRRRLSHADRFPTFPKWSRSGRQIAYNITTGANFVGEIHTVDSAGVLESLLAQDVSVDAPTTWGLEIP